MTAVCGGGSSQPKQIAPVIVFLSGAALTAVAVETLGLSAIWADLIGFAAGQSFSTSTLCATDPPAMPTFTVADITTLIGSTPFLSPTAYDKLNTLTEIAAWYVYCECSSTTSTPAPPAAPAYPTGAPVINPPTAPTLTQAPCWDVNVPFTIPASNPTGATHQQMANRLLPAGTPITVTPPTTGGPTTAYPFPPGISNAKWTITANPTTSLGPSIWSAIYSASGALLASNILFDYSSGGLPNTATRSLTIPAGGAYWWLDGISYWANTSNRSLIPYEVDVEFSYFCSNQTPQTPLTDCCPPDPILQAKLEQILNALASIYTSLPTQLNSFAESTVHAGLSGSGNAAIGASTIALKVELTTIPGSLGRSAGDPVEYFDAGFLTTSAAEGAYRSHRIEHTPQLFILGALVDAFHWTLGAGVVARVTELTRGP